MLYKTDNTIIYVSVNLIRKSTVQIVSFLYSSELALLRSVLTKVATKPGILEKPGTCQFRLKILEF